MTEPQLFVLRGIPASGKTTFARLFVEHRVEAHRPTVRVNLDELRAMLYPQRYVVSTEPTVQAIEMSCVSTAIVKGFSVVIDAMNLPNYKLERWRAARTTFGLPDIILFDFEIPLDLCLDRNSIRPTQLRVPVQRMKDMHALLVQARIEEGVQPGLLDGYKKVPVTYNTDLASLLAENP